MEVIWQEHVSVLPAVDFLSIRRKEYFNTKGLVLHDVCVYIRMFIMPQISTHLGGIHLPLDDLLLAWYQVATGKTIAV